MDFIFRNIPVLLVFLTTAAFAWLYGGSRADALVPIVPWLWTFLLEALLFFPQRRPYEDAVSARRRVWHELKRDPVLYLVLFFLLLLLIPLANKGLCPSCDYPEILAGTSPKPPLPFLPFCVNISEHYGVLQWFVPILTAMLVARRALTRHGKRLLVEMMVWNGAAVAVLGFIQSATGAPFPYWEKIESPVYFFATFGYPNMGGAYFTMLFAFAVGVWQMRVGEIADLPRIDRTRSVWDQMLIRIFRAHYMLVPAMLNLFGAMFTLSRAAILLVSVLAVFAFIYFFIRLLFARKERVKRVKQAALSVLGVVGLILLVLVFAPADLGKEVSSVSSFEVLDRVSGKGQYHTRVATAIFKDYPFFGVGGWGYKHFCMSYMTGDELKQLQTVGGVNVHNDYLQFLCEHGLAGGLSLLAIFLFLTVPLFRAWFKLYRAARFEKPEKAPPPPRVLYALPAGTLWILLGNTALLVHSFGDCPMRSAAVLSTFFVSLACADGWLPHNEEETSK